MELRPLPLTLSEPLHSADHDVRSQPPNVTTELGHGAVCRDEEREDVEPGEAVERDEMRLMQMGGLWSAETSVGEMRLDPDRYDVDKALRSDEPTNAELEPEGEGPARRRYVRPDPDEGIIRASIALVREPAALNRRPRRHP